MKPGAPRAVVAWMAVVFGVTGGAFVLMELGPFAAGGIISLFVAWSLQRQLRDELILESVREIIATFRADQERTIIHLLHEGFPLCGFTRKLPKDWPSNTRWVGKDEFDRNYLGDDVCVQCLAELGKLEDQSESGAVRP